MTDHTKPHLVFLATPAIGHLVPAMEISEKLTTGYGLQVTICLVSSGGHTSPAVATLIQSAKSNCKYLDFVQLPPPDLASIPADASAYSKLCAIMRLSMPALKAALLFLKAPPNAIMADHLGAEAFEVARELGLAKYMYAHVSAWSLALDLYGPVLDKEVTGEFLDLKEQIKIPGCRSIEVGEFHDAMNHRTSDAYKSYLKLGACAAIADGFFVNTWEGLQSSTLAALRQGDLLGKLINMAPMYDVGPIVRRPTGSREHELFRWLDKQPVESVLYVSFGSVANHTPEEINEIAFGLEISKQRFIWVVRPPVAATRDGVFLGAKENDPSSYLPDGFLERTREFGLVIAQWVPQVEVLGHLSIGGFLFHSGWNSCLEAIICGLPMIVCPLHADNFMNARMLVDEFEVAVRPKLWPSMAVIGREEIMGMVRKIMVEEDGSQIRKRAKELKKSAEEALMEGGSSFNSLSRFVTDIRKKSSKFPFFFFLTFPIRLNACLTSVLPNFFILFYDLNISSGMLCS